MRPAPTSAMLSGPIAALPSPPPSLPLPPSPPSLPLSQSTGQQPQPAPGPAAPPPATRAARGGGAAAAAGRSNSTRLSDVEETTRELRPRTDSAATYEPPLPRCSRGPADCCTALPSLPPLPPSLSWGPSPPPPSPPSPPSLAQTPSGNKPLRVLMSSHSDPPPPLPFPMSPNKYRTGVCPIILRPCVRRLGPSRR